jgi:DNA-binding MarR family transcriptional regulator
MTAVASERQVLYARMHRALREFPRYNQFLTNANGLSISPPESHILVEVGGHGKLEYSTLVELIGLEKTAISKLIRGLCRQELIVATLSERDKRSKDLVLTIKGQRLLKTFDTAANQRLEQFDLISGFTARERHDLAAILGSLADALHAQRTVTRSKEHILRPAIRRLTRAFQLLGRRALGSKLNTLEWQTLLTLCENSAVTTPSQLCRDLEVSKSSLALALSELERQDLITRVQQEDDGRFFNLQPKRAGIHVVTALEVAAISDFSAWKGVTRHGIELVERWIRAAAFYYHIERKTLTLRHLESKEDLDRARRETLVRYLSNAQTDTVPASCFDPRSRCFGLYQQDGKLVAAVELKGAKPAHLQNVFIDEGLSLETARAFIARAVAQSMDQEVVVSSRLPFSYVIPKPEVCSVLGRLFIEAT